MGVAHTLFRGFFWSDNILWKEDVDGIPLSVFLAGRDQIVNSDEVARYLTGDIRDDDSYHQSNWKGEPGGWSTSDDMLRVFWCDDLDHAQIFDDAICRDRLVREVSRRTLVNS